MFVSAAAEQIPSAILTGSPKIEHTAPFNETEFQELLARTVAGTKIEWIEGVRLREDHWRQLRDAVFLSRLAHAEAVFESGRSRGRTGALLCLGACQDLIEALIPDAKGHLCVIEALGAALVAADEELPRLFRPGLDADDDRKHLSIVPKEIHQ